MTARSEDGTTRTPSPLVRWVLLPAAVLVLALIPVGLALLLVGPLAAESVYVGIVLMTSVVTAMDGRDRLLAAAEFTLVATAGAAIGGHLGLLLLAVVATCALQIPFTRRSARAVGALPAILVLFSLSPGGGAGVVTVAIGVAAGSLFMIGVARLARMSPAPDPVPLRDAVVHGAVLAAGCGILLLLVIALDLPRPHWALLAFCLMVAPARSTWRSAARYAGATAAGALIATALGALVPPAGEVLLLLAAMIGTVALTLAGRKELSVVPLVAAVVLLGTVLSGEASAALALQRTGMALLALLVAAALLALAQLVTRQERAAGPAATAPPR
ncbi:hypothetical protein NLU66_04635 [Brachybacterium sp. NBEC-018]|uniref:FUSC family protein n=1 Tax=Brachybacterium sp. NBEC-018 TaxID=2996004 RepID=UPI0021754ECA|nr:FUSC family protein [Brachybacterium sp. NBEC-018]UVY84889.1 hypothetical protein NLU66_04635 [Brachybacterium sp. NBEC-018]